MKRRTGAAGFTALARTLPGAPSLQGLNGDGTTHEMEQLISAHRPSWRLRVAIGLGLGAGAALAWYALAGS